MFELELNTVLSFLNGAQAILIMGYDGVVVESVTQGPSDHFQDLAIELGHIIKNIAELSKASNTGGFSEMTLHFDRSKILLRSIHPDYFLALLLSREENIGKSQFAIQRILPDIVKKL